MKNIQSLTLMMAVMVYAAPTPNEQRKERLDAIRKTSNILHNKELHFKVLRVTSGNGSNCPLEFFCLAEKVLKDNSTQEEIKKANLTTHVAGNITKLIRELEQYNKLTPVNCSLNRTLGQHSMAWFLEDIKECAKH